MHTRRWLKCSTLLLVACLGDIAGLLTAQTIPETTIASPDGSVKLWYRTQNGGYGMWLTSVGNSSGKLFNLKQVDLRSVRFRKIGEPYPFETFVPTAQLGGISPSASSFPSTSHFKTPTSFTFTWNNVSHPSLQGSAGPETFTVTVTGTAVNGVGSSPGRIELGISVAMDAPAPGATHSVFNVIFPRITVNERISNPQTPFFDEILTVPQSSGWLVVDPTHNNHGFLAGGALAHPGLLSMQFFAYYNDDENHDDPVPAPILYMGTLDTEGDDKEFFGSQDSSVTPASFTLGLSRLNADSLTAQSFTRNYPFVLSVLQGDWYDACRYYRSLMVGPGIPWTAQGPMCSNPSFSSVLKNTHMFLRSAVNSCSSGLNSNIDFPSFEAWDEQLVDHQTAFGPVAMGNLNMTTLIYHWELSGFSDGNWGEWAESPCFANEVNDPAFLALSSWHHYACYFNANFYSENVPSPPAPDFNTFVRPRLAQDSLHGDEVAGHDLAEGLHIAEAAPAGTSAIKVTSTKTGTLKAETLIAIENKPQIYTVQALVDFFGTPAIPDPMKAVSLDPPLADAVAVNDKVEIITAYRRDVGLYCPVTPPPPPLQDLCNQVAQPVQQTTWELDMRSPFFANYLQNHFGQLQGLGAGGLYLDAFNIGEPVRSYNELVTASNPTLRPGGGSGRFQAKRQALQSVFTGSPTDPFAFSEGCQEMMLDLVSVVYPRHHDVPAAGRYDVSGQPSILIAPMYQTVYHDYGLMTEAIEIVGPEDLPGPSGGPAVDDQLFLQLLRRIYAVNLFFGHSPYGGSLMSRITPSPPPAPLPPLSRIPDLATTFHPYYSVFIDAIKHYVAVYSRPLVRDYVTFGERVRDPDKDNFNTVSIEGPEWVPYYKDQPYIYVSAYARTDLAAHTRLGVSLVNWLDASDPGSGGTGTQSVDVTIDPLKYNLQPIIYTLTEVKDDGTLHPIGSVDFTSLQKKTYHVVVPGISARFFVFE